MLALVAVACMGWPGDAAAHVAGEAGGFLSGLQHPIAGPDHLLAMLAVGIWGAQIGGRSVWSLPITFPLVMALGGVLGMQGVPVGPVEIAIALSVIVLGLAILAAWRAPESIALVIVGAFAIYHGWAHGAELPTAVDPVAYGFGFVVATGAIHILGIAFGLLLGRLVDGWVSRIAGGLIGGMGVWFLVGA
ncbi:MAG: urease accessory protein [Rhizobiales bacterium]|nr:urease accessory protein [Hyphomicrobiales bacterium]